MFGAASFLSYLNLPIEVTIKGVITETRRGRASYKVRMSVNSMATWYQESRARDREEVVVGCNLT